MAYEAGSFDTVLAVAAGDDPALLRELRKGFFESLVHQIDLLRRSRCDANWIVAAQRLKGLGASFHAPGLPELAELALESAPGDPAIVRQLEEFAVQFQLDELD